MRKKFILLFLFILMLICLTGCGKTYSLNAYYDCKESGYNGKGMLQPQFEDLELAELIAEEAKLSEEERMNLLFSIDEALDVEWSKSSELSNGDVVFIRFNQESIKKFNEEHKKFKLEAKDFSYTVSGLKDINEVDFFEDVSVRTSGFSSEGKAEAFSEKYPNLTFSVTPNRGIANGDEVMIELPKTNEEFYVENFGGIPTRYSIPYIIDDLDQYVSSLEQLTDEALDLILGDVRNRMVTYETKKFDMVLGITNHIEKLILLTSKDTSNKKNKLYVIYSQNGEYNKKGNATPIPFARYSYYEYEDIVVSSDGTVYVDVSDPNAPDYTYGIGTGFEIGNRKIPGYENYENCYKDLVTKNLSKWNCEEMAVGVEKKTDLSDVVAAYSQFVSNSSEIEQILDYCGYMGYSFLYIDEDEIPELAVGFFVNGANAEQDIHKAMTWSENEMYEVVILTYDGEKVSILDDISALDYGISYAPKENSVYVAGGDGEHVQYMNLKIKENAFSLIHGFSTEFNDDTNEFDYYKLLSRDWQSDREPIDESVFKAFEESFESTESKMEDILEYKYYQTVDIAAENNE